jgi:hypothetical protein
MLYHSYMYSTGTVIFGYPITERMHKELMRVDHGETNASPYMIADVIESLEREKLGRTAYSGAGQEPAWIGVDFAGLDAIGDRDSVHGETSATRLDQSFSPSQADITEAKRRMAEFARRYPTVAALAPDADVYIMWGTS